MTPQPPLSDRDGGGPYVGFYNGDTRVVWRPKGSKTASELFWQSMSFCSTPGGTDAICLMSRILGMDALDHEDASEQERIGRARIKSIVGFLKRRVPGFEDSVVASIAPRVGVPETRRICGQHTLTAEEILAERTFEDSVALGCGPMEIHDPNGTGIVLSMPPAPSRSPCAAWFPLGNGVAAVAFSIPSRS